MNTEDLTAEQTKRLRSLLSDAGYHDVPDDELTETYDRAIDRVLTRTDVEATLNESLQKARDLTGLQKLTSFVSADQLISTFAEVEGYLETTSIDGETIWVELT